MQAAQLISVIGAAGGLSGLSALGGWLGGNKLHDAQQRQAESAQKATDVTSALAMLKEANAALVRATALLDQALTYIDDMRTDMMAAGIKVRPMPDDLRHAMTLRE